MVKNIELGFYNKYIFNNNSYLSLHIIKKNYNRYKNSKNLFQIIDTDLELGTNTIYLTNLKNKIKNNKTRKASYKIL